MSEEMPTAPSAPDYGAPPYGAHPAERSVREELSEPPRMSPGARLINIFFSPGEVFQDVRRSPRDWWLPLVVFVALAAVSGYIAESRLDLSPESLAKAATDTRLEQQGKSRKDLSQQEAQGVETAEKVAATMIRFGPLTLAVFWTVGYFMLAGIYRLLALLFQAQTTFFRLLSVAVYSSYVPGVVKALLQIVIAFIRKPGDIDPAAFLANNGLIATGPAALVSATAHPVLKALLGTFDVFYLWALVLTVIGIAAVSRKLSTGTALVMAVIPYALWFLIATAFAALTSH